MDDHAHVSTNLDAILSGEMVESVEESLEEAAETDIFMDAHAEAKTKLDDILSGNIEESKELTESYRRIVSRGNLLTDNELFVDFD